MQKIYIGSSQKILNENMLNVIVYYLVEKLELPAVPERDLVSTVWEYSTEHSYL